MRTLQTFQVLSASALLFSISACTSGIFNRSGVVDSTLGKSISIVSNKSNSLNLSIINQGEIEMKLLSLMPDATIKQNNTDYDLFSYQENPYGFRFATLHGLSLASQVAGGPNVSISNTTRTNITNGYGGLYNGKLDLTNLPGFTVPQAFMPARHFSDAFVTQFNSVLNSLNGNPTPIANIGFRSMTSALCDPSNLLTSPMFNSAGWLDGPTSSDPIRMHIHSMASQAWLIPLSATSNEVNLLRKAYDDLLAQATTDAVASPSNRAYMGVCQGILLSPQFWIGPTGKGQALIRATSRLVGRLPTQAEMRAYLTGSKTFANIVKDFLKEKGFKSEIGKWHISQLGINLSTGGAFGGAEFWNKNWLYDFQTPGRFMITRSAWNNPSGGSESNWIAESLESNQQTFENLLQLSYTESRFVNNPDGTPSTDGLALKAYVERNVNDGNGQKNIVSQPFDNRSTGMWLKRYNTLTDRMEFIGGYMVDLGNTADNEAQLATQTGYPGSEFGSRCSVWTPARGRWFICLGQVTDKNFNSISSDLKLIPMDLSAPATGLGSAYKDVPLFGKAVADRWSPSGKQNGWSSVTLPFSHDPIWVGNTFNRFFTTCVPRRTAASNPLPNPVPAQTYAGDKMSTLAIADQVGFGVVGWTERAVLSRFSWDGYGNTSIALFMDPITLDSFHCGKVNTAAMTAHARPPIADGDTMAMNNWDDATFDEVVPFGPKGFNDRSTGAPDQSQLTSMAWFLNVNSTHVPGYQNLVAGNQAASMDSAMFAADVLGFAHSYPKIIEAEALMEPIRLLEAIIDNRDGLGDYRKLVTSPITYGSNFYQYYLASSGNALPFWPEGFTPKFGLDRFTVSAIDRRNFKAIDAQVVNNHTLMTGAQSVFFPLPPNTGVMTMFSFTRPVSFAGGKMRTMAARILSRLVPAVDAYQPKNTTLHKSYFLNQPGQTDAHLQPACIGCHINLDPLVRALYADWNCQGNQGIFQQNNWRERVCKWEVGGVASNISTGHKGTGALFDQTVSGWEQVASVVANNRLFALNAVNTAYNNLYRPVGSISSEHNTMISTVTDHFISGGYIYADMIAELMTYKNIFEEAP